MWFVHVLCNCEKKTKILEGIKGAMREVYRSPLTTACDYFPQMGDEIALRLVDLAVLLVLVCIALSLIDFAVRFFT